MYLRNHAYCCPLCGNIWGRLVFREPPLHGWIFTPRGCVEHGGGFLIDSVNYKDYIEGLPATETNYRWLCDEILLWNTKNDFDYLARR